MRKKELCWQLTRACRADSFQKFSLNLGVSYLEIFKANDSEHILPNVRSLSVFSEGNSNM